MTDSLYDDIIAVLDDGKYHPVKDLCCNKKYDLLEVKAFLLELLKKKYVLCKGSHWKLLKKQDKLSAPVSRIEERSEIYVVCPACKNRLLIQEDFIGMKAQCTVCQTAFFISSIQNNPNEYKTIAIEQVQNEK